MMRSLHSVTNLCRSWPQCPPIQAWERTCILSMHMTQTLTQGYSTTQSQVRLLYSFNCRTGDFFLLILRVLRFNCTLLFLDVLCCSQVYFVVVPRCTLLLFLGVLCCSYVYFVVPRCTLLFLGVLCCFQVYFVVPRCTLLFLGVRCCSQVYLFVPGCTLLLLGVLCCSQVYFVVPM